MHYFLDISLNISAIYIPFSHLDSAQKGDFSGVWHAIYSYVKTLLNKDFIFESPELIPLIQKFLFGCSGSSADGTLHPWAYHPTRPI